MGIFQSNHLKTKVLFNCKSWNEKIILLNVSRYTSETISIDTRPIDEPFSVNFHPASPVPKGQAVEKRRLTGTTSSHDSQKFSRLNHPAYYFKVITVFIE